MSFVAGIRFASKILLGFIVLIIVTNEYSFLTIRSNIIAGLSRKEFLNGKILLIASLSVAAGIVIFIAGLYLGLTNSVNITFTQIFSRLGFLLAFIYEVFSYLIFILFLGLLIKKLGLTIIMHIAWMIAEPIISYKLPDGFGDFLPFNAMNNLLTGFNSSLIKIHTPGSLEIFQDSIQWQSLIFCTAYLLLFIIGSRRILKIRDF